MSGRNNFLAELDNFAADLMTEAKGATATGEDGAPIGFLDRLKLFDSLTRWVAVKHKIDPEDDKDAFGKLADKFHGRGRGKRGRSAIEAAEQSGGSSDADPATDSAVIPFRPNGGSGDAPFTFPDAPAADA